jgi:hypothetical protein
LHAGKSIGIAVSMDIKTGKSTLHYAAEMGSLTICKMLVDAGGVPSNIDKYGKTPLHLAVIGGHLNVVQFLLAHVKPWMFHVPSKMTLVQTAARYGQFRILEALLHYGFIAIEKNGEGETALHLAARHGHVDVLRVLVEHGAEIHATTKTLGQTPLHYACITGQTEAAVFLVRRGADVHMPDHTPARKTSLDKCEDCANRNCLNMVLRASAEFRKVISDLDESGRREHYEAVAKIQKLAVEKEKLDRHIQKQTRREGYLVTRHERITDMKQKVADGNKRMAARSNSPSKTVNLSPIRRKKSDSIKKNRREVLFGPKGKGFAISKRYISKHASNSSSNSSDGSDSDGEEGSMLSSRYDSRQRSMSSRISSRSESGESENKFPPIVSARRVSNGEFDQSSSSSRPASRPPRPSVKKVFGVFHEHAPLADHTFHGSTHGREELTSHLLAHTQHLSLSNATHPFNHHF